MKESTDITDLQKMKEQDRMWELLIKINLTVLNERFNHRSVTIVLSLLEGIICK